MPLTEAGKMLLMGRGGHIAGYDVLIRSNRIDVMKGDRHWSHEVPNYGTDVLDLMNRQTARLGWAQVEDMEILYFYDPGDGGFGYGLNLTVDYFSEWGFSPFPQADDMTIETGEGS